MLIKLTLRELPKMRKQEDNLMKINQLTDCLGKMKIVRRHLIKWILIVPLSFLSGWVSAQNVKLDASAPRVVQIGEQFRLVYSFNAKGSNFSEPVIKDFSVLTGPNVSSSSSIQIINGNMSQSVNYSYTYILVAGTEGKFTIPSASVEFKGKVYTSNEVTVEVVKGAGAAAASSAPSGTPTSSVDEANISDSRLFVAINVDRKTVYQGEHLTATIKVYTKENLAGFEDIKFPPYTGFWSQDIETPSQISLQRENVNGQIYDVGVFKKTLLFPQRSGEITIDPFDITMLIHEKIRSNNPFDDFFGGSYRTLKKHVSSAPIKINVKPLPANQPDNFSGAVGRMQMTATVDKNHVKANEAINLRIKISGNGNLKLIKPLKVDFPPDMDVYDPKTTVNTSANEQGVTGNIVFEYLFIPRYAGNFRIAPITFSYFDLDSKQYKTLSSSQFQIVVDRGDSEPQQSTSGVVSGLTKEDVKYIGKDIRFIKTGFSLQKKQTYILGTIPFTLVYVGSFIIFLLIIIVRRTQIKQNANQAKVKNRKANKISRKRLKKALKYMKANESANFYTEILKATWGYLSDKLSIPISNLSKDNVSEILEIHQVDKETLKNLMELLDACEFARFAPSAISGGMEDIYKKVGELISKLDQKIK